MIVLSRFRFFVTFVLSRITNCLFLSVLLISVSKSTESTRFLLLFHQNYLQQQMLHTNYYGCCRLFQTIIKNCKVPHLKSTDLNRMGVTQNRRQKVFNRGLCISAGVFGFVRGDLILQKLTKSQLIYSVSCFNLGGLEFCLGG